MAIQRRASAFPTGANSANASAVIPAGTVVGDLMLLFWFTANDGTNVAPTGWTFVNKAVGTTTTNQAIWVYKRVAISGDAGATAGGGGAAGMNLGAATSQGAAIVVYYDDVGGSVDVDASGVGNGTFTAPNVTITHTDVGVTSASVRNASTGTETWGTIPASYTKVDNDFASGGAGKAWCVAENLTTSTGTQNGGTFAPGGAGGTNAAAVTLGLFATSSSLAAALTSTSALGGAVTTVYTGTATMKSTTRARAGGFPKVANLTSFVTAAHRGGLGEGPSETMGAYNQSMPLDAWIAAEGDAQLNASGSIVLWHDATLADGTTTVASRTDAQWNTVTVAWPGGHTGTPDPYPAAYWSDLADAWGELRILVPEMKDTGAVDLPLQADIKARGLVDSTIIQCFDLTRAKQAASAGFHAMALFGTTAPNTTQLADLATNGVEFVGMDVSSGGLDATAVSNAHAAGIKIWGYVANSTTSRDSYRTLGADGVFTNFPAALDIPGTGTFAGPVTVVQGGVAALTSTSALAGSTAATRPAAATMGSGSALSATTAATVQASAALTSTSALAGATTATVQASATATSTTALAGSTTATMQAAAALTSTSALAAAGVIAGSLTVTITSTTSLASATPTRTQPATAAVVSATALGGQVAATYTASGALTSTTALGGTATAGSTLTATLTSTTALAGTVVTTGYGAATLATVSMLTAATSSGGARDLILTVTVGTDRWAVAASRDRWAVTSTQEA